MKNKILNSALLLLFSGLIIMLSGCTGKNIEHESSKYNNIDGSHMSSSELIEMFESEGYTIRMERFIYTGSSDKSVHILLDNEKRGTTVERIVNTLVGTLMTYRNRNISKEYADILDLSDNNTNEKKQLYNNFMDLLKQYNITQTQISDMLDYYYRTNPDKIEIINMDDYLH